MMELIFDTEYTDGTKAEAHRVPCGTWESTEEASSRPSKGGDMFSHKALSLILNS